MKKLMIILVLAVASIGTLTLAGCSNKAVTQQLAYPDTQGDKGITIESFQAQYQGNVLRVQAEISNSNKKNARIFYRFRWLDGQGNVVASNDQWKPLLIYGKQSAFAVGAAPHPDVVDYRFEFNVEYPIH